MIMSSSDRVTFAICVLVSCLLIGPQLSGSLRVHEDDDDFELEAIPLEDAFNLLTSTERRAYNPDLEDNRTFGVIVDCGSSGTRAHLYEWDARLSYPQLLHHIEPMRGPDEKPLSKKFSPSLSSFADDPTKELEKYIQQVLDYIESYIPRKSHPFTGVYILATAGMRLLDDDTQKRIMDDIAAYIGREYNFAKVKTSVISGAHEGMYQWISVNAKAKRFLGQGTSGRTKTFAVIEMGGASAQVTYQLRPGVGEMVSSLLMDEDTRQVYRAQIVEPQLSRKDNPENSYTLHSTTFLGFGSNSAREAYLDLLLHKHIRGSGFDRFLSWGRKLLKSCFDPTINQKPEDSGDGDDEEASKAEAEKKKMMKQEEELLLEDPCSPEGFVTDKPLKKPKRLLESKDKILGFLLEEDEPYFTYKVKGTGNYRKCKKLIEQMLELSKRERLNCKPNEEEKCTMTLLGEHFVPFDSIDFLGIGDIYYTTNLMLRSAGTYNHKRIAKRTKKICDTPYDKLVNQFSYLNEDPKLKSRISDECFKAVWVDAFLVKGLSMPTDLSSLKTVGQINNDDLEWTLGAVLDKSLAIEEAADTNAEQLYGPENKDTHVVVPELLATTRPQLDGSDVERPAEDEEEEEELDLGLDDE